MNNKAFVPSLKSGEFSVELKFEQFSNNIDDYPDGIIIPIDKPYRWTSADVIRKIKYAACRHFGKKKLKVGHAGTLDPLATGVLLVCIGNATKLAETLQSHHKEYIAGISFGATTPSYDLEKEIDAKYPFEHITEEKVAEALVGFIGEQDQIAPLFSAKSIDGVRAYELARKLYKKDPTSVEAATADLIRTAKIEIFAATLMRFIPSNIDIFSENINEINENDGASSRIKVFETSHLGLPRADVRLSCTKGTYIRAVARDLGEALNSGAHLDGLIRSKSGDFHLGNCLNIEQAMSLFSFDRE